MDSIGHGVYRMVSDDPDAELQVLKGLTAKLVDEQRVRLNEQHPEFVWWADLVFFVKDMNAIATLLRLQENEDLSETVGNLVAAFVQNVLEKVFPGDPEKVTELLGKIVVEGQALDGLIEKEMHLRYAGAMEQ